MKDHARTPGGSQPEPRTTLVHEVIVDDEHPHRIDNDEPIRVAVRWFDDAAPLIEVEGVGASGFVGVDWLTVDEAKEQVLALLYGIVQAQKRPGVDLTTGERIGLVSVVTGLLKALAGRVDEGAA